MTELRRWTYVALLAAFGAAAVVHLAVPPVRSALWAMGGPHPLALMADCGFYPLCAFGDPPGSALRLFLGDELPSPGAGPTLRDRYAMAHGPWIVSLLIVALIVRRVRSWRSSHRIDPPAAFDGFWFALAAVGLFLVPFGYLGGWMLTFYFMRDPIHFGVFVAFIALLVVELRWGRSPRAAPPEPVAAEGVDAPTAIARRRPVWTLAAVLLPIGCPGIALLGTSGVRGMGAVAIVLLAVVGGLVLGAISTVVAIVRKERWIPLQVLAFLMNFGVGLLLLGKFAH